MGGLCTVTAHLTDGGSSGSHAGFTVQPHQGVESKEPPGFQPLTLVHGSGLRCRGFPCCNPEVVTGGES